MRRLLAIVSIVCALAASAPRAASARPGPRARLVGIVLSSGQALVWDAAAKRYVLLRVGSVFHGVRVLGLGPDRILAEREGRKFIWKLGAPTTLHPDRVGGGQGRRPALIVTPAAPPPPGPARPRAAGPKGLPPVPRAADEPRKVVKRQGVLALAFLAGLAADFVAAAREIRVVTGPSRRVRLVWLRQGGALERAGLAVGDLVLRVQGRALAGAADAAEVFASLKRGGVLRLEIQRKDELVELTVRLR